MKTIFVPRTEYYHDLLSRAEAHNGDVGRILDRSRELEFPDLEDVALLLAGMGDELITRSCREAAKEITERVFGNRVAIFIPLYFSNQCRNDCGYCGFARRHKIERRRLTVDEFRLEVKELVRRGFTGVELVSAEDPFFTPSKVAELIKVCKREGMRAVVTNIGVLDNKEDYELLKDAGLDTWVQFQETYDPETYAAYHPAHTHKGNLALRFEAYEMAAAAGIRGIGLGTLLGLSDWKPELLAMVDHARHLKEKFSSVVSFSVPRLQPVAGSQVPEDNPTGVDDGEFLNFVAMLRIAFPYAAIAISTRETAKVRKNALEIAGTSTSAESSTAVGGYTERTDDVPQFPVHSISLDDTIRDIISIGKMPSFCTACSELRVEGDFYRLAKEGKLKAGCLKNAVITYGEYCLRKNGDNRPAHFVHDFRSRPKGDESGS